MHDMHAIMQTLQQRTPDPATTDRLLQEASARPPFYPADPALTRWFITQKENGTALDTHLRQAAGLSAPLRQAVLARGRTADRQGVFTTIVLPNAARPDETLIVKLRRHPSVGAGYGTFGGIVEPHEYDGTVTGLMGALLRECGEEAAEVLDAPTRAQLLAIMGRARTLPLFTCRDDSHVIDRGWGWTVDANAFVTVVSDPNDQVALVAMLRAQGVVPDAHVTDNSAHEVLGLAMFSLQHAPAALASLLATDNAPDSTTQHHYGHEALGEVAGVEKALDVSNITFPVRQHYLQTPGLLPFVAGKMRISEYGIRQLLAATNAHGGMMPVAVPDSAYAALATTGSRTAQIMPAPKA